MFNGSLFSLNKPAIDKILTSSSLFKLSKCNGIIVVKTDTPLSSKPSSLSSVPSSTLSGERTRPSSPENTDNTPQRESVVKKRMDPPSPTPTSKKYFSEDVIRNLKNMAERYSYFTVNLDGKYIKFDPALMNMPSFLNYLKLGVKHYTMTIKNDHITLTSSPLTSQRVLPVNQKPTTPRVLQFKLKQDFNRSEDPFPRACRQLVYC